MVNTFINYYQHRRKPKDQWQGLIKRITIFERENQETAVKNDDNTSDYLPDYRHCIIRFQIRRDCF